VVDDSRIAGIVSRHDVLAALLRADADIEMAVRKVVAMHAGPGVDVVVEWGAVTLTGSTELRSAARRLPAVVADVDGVMTVDSDAVEWDINDEILPVAQL
jgi:osmotically-inducible protein OsmY